MALELNHHTGEPFFHLTRSLTSQLSQCQLMLINPIFMKLDKQTHTFTEQNKLLETTVKHLFWPLHLLRCKVLSGGNWQAGSSSRFACLQSAVWAAMAWEMGGGIRTSPLWLTELEPREWGCWPGVQALIHPWDVSWEWNLLSQCRRAWRQQGSSDPQTKELATESLRQTGETHEFKKIYIPEV